MANKPRYVQQKFRLQGGISDIVCHEFRKSNFQGVIEHNIYSLYYIQLKQGRSRRLKISAIPTWGVTASDHTFLGTVLFFFLNEKLYTIKDLSSVYADGMLRILRSDEKLGRRAPRVVSCALILYYWRNKSLPCGGWQLEISLISERSQLRLCLSSSRKVCTPAQVDGHSLWTSLCDTSRRLRIIGAEENAQLISQVPLVV